VSDVNIGRVLARRWEGVEKPSTEGIRRESKVRKRGRRESSRNGETVGREQSRSRGEAVERRVEIDVRSSKEVRKRGKRVRAID